jgi:FkbM family methyltransferase
MSRPDTHVAGEQSAVDKARRHLDDGPTPSWEAPSRFGAGAALARRGLRRLLRPYTVRQDPFERAVVDAVVGLTAATEAAIATTYATPLSGDDVIDADTAVGPLWLHRNDQVITPYLAAGNVWEPALTAFLRRTIQPGMTFVDVGANIGYFSVLARQLTGPTGSVIAVEPQPGTLDILRANLWRHGFLDALVLPFAAYSRFGHLELVLNEENRGGSVMGRENAGTKLIPCAPVDELLGRRSVDVMKVDAEGCDHVVFQGASRTIAANRGLTIVVEFWPHRMIRDRPPPDVLDLYEESGFALHRIAPDGTLVAMSREAVLEQTEDFFELVLLRS